MEEKTGKVTTTLILKTTPKIPMMNPATRRTPTILTSMTNRTIWKIQEKATSRFSALQRAELSPQSPSRSRPEQSTEQELAYTCPECNRKCKRSAGLKLHRRSAHSRA